MKACQAAQRTHRVGAEAAAQRSQRERAASSQGHQIGCLTLHPKKPASRMPEQTLLSVLLSWAARRVRNLWLLMLFPLLLLPLMPMLLFALLS